MYDVCTIGYAVRVDRLHFDWDPRKASANRAKHGVAFEEAVSVFADESAMLLDDPDHSDEEDRFILLGLSVRLRILVVVHAHREPAGVVRIVSARRATRAERGQYVDRRFS
jgi:uncharacterized DUF497 family protein